MRWLRIALIFAGILLATVIVAIVLLFTVDLGRFKPQAESLASDLIGRRIYIDDEFSPSLGEEIRVVAGDVRIVNPDWAESDTLLRAKRLDVSLDLRSLLSLRYDLTNVAIDDLVIALEQGEDGANNWTLFESDPAEEAEAETDEPASPLELVIRQAKIRDLVVTYVDPARESPLRFAASSVDQVQLDSGDVQLELDGDLNGTPVTLDVTAGTFAEILAAGEVRYDLSGDLGEISISSNARIDSLAQPVNPVGQLEISGPNAEYLTDVLGIAPITRGPLNLVATIKPVADEMHVQVQGEFGEFEIDVVGSFSDLQDFDDVNIDFSAAGPDAATFGALTGLDGIPADPYSIRGTLRGEGETAIAGTVAIEIGETEFDASANIDKFPDIDGAVVNLKIDGPDFGRFNKLVGLPGELTGPFSLTAELSQSPDGEELVDVAAEAQDVQFRISGVVSTAPEFVGTNLAVSVSGDDLSVVASALDFPDMPDVPFGVTAELSRLERGIEIDDGRATFGDDVITIEGLVSNAPLEKDTDLRFRVAGPDLAATLKAAGIEVELLPAGSFETAGRIRRRPDHFALDGITARVGATRAKLDGRLGNLKDFSGTDVDVEIDGDSLAGVAPEISDLRFADVPFSVASKVRIAKDQLNLAGLKVRIGQGRLDGDASIGMSPMLESGSVSISAGGPSVAEWAPSYAEFVPADAPFDLSGAARWRGDRLTVERVVLEIAKGRIAASGEVDIAEFSKTNFDLNARIASMSNLGRIAGMELPDEPLALSAKLVGSENALTLRDFSLMAGPSDLAGTATYDTSAELPSFDVDLRSTYLDPTPFLPTGEAEAEPETAPTPDDGRLIPDTPLPVDVLSKLNARARLSVGELILPNGPVKNVLLDGSLRDGALRVERFALTGDRGTLAGELQALPEASGLEIRGNIDGTAMTLGLTPSAPGAFDLLPRYDFQVKLDARGTTYRELAGSLDGTVRLIGGSGQTKGIPTWFMRDVTAEVIEKVNPFRKKDPFMHIQCFTVLLRSVGGQVDGVPAVVLQTDKLNIIGVAYADLGTEAIDVKIESAARKGLGLGAADFITPYTKISGTMAEPKLAFDTEEAVARGTQTVATLGTAWIAKKVKSRFFGPKDPCGKAVAEADAEMEAGGAN